MAERFRQVLKSLPRLSTVSDNRLNQQNVIPIGSPIRYYGLESL